MTVTERVESSEEADEARLHELGYAQELKRGMSWFSNFAVSFTIISILTGGITTFYLGMDAGGPRTITWGWLFVGGMVTLIGLAMAEICSSYPTAGGLYYWSAKLATRNAAAWAWFTGWFNLLGQVAVTASIDFGLATFLGFFIKLAIYGSFAAKPWQILLLYAIVLGLHGALNTVGVGLVAKLNDVSAWWHVAGTAVIVVLLFVLPDHHQPLSSVFGSYVNSTGLDWFPGSGIWITLVGLALPAYTLTGFDASAHLTEETKDAAVSGPRGIVTSIVVSVIAGFILMVALCWALPGGVSSQAYSTAAAGGSTAAANVILASLSRHTAEFLIIVSIVAQFFCGMASITANSRMIYAFSRDGAVPGHRLWHRINPRTRTPTNSVWFAAVFAFLLGVPSLITNSGGVPIAFFAIVSVAVVALEISYILPVILRRLAGDHFQPGPWHLGRWSGLIGWTAVAWVGVISLPFLLPQFTLHVGGTFSWSAFNYAPAALLIVIGYATITWFASARKWFTGPKVQGSAEEIAAIEAELASIA
jgi:amino acid transporter